MMAISQAVKATRTVTKKEMGMAILAGVLNPTKRTAAVKIGTTAKNAIIDGDIFSGLLFYIGWYYVYWQKNEWSTHMSS